MVEATDGTRALPLTAAKHRALLAACLLDPGTVVSIDRLIDGLWGEHPPTTAAALVHSYVCALRRVLGAKRLVTRSPGYLMVVDTAQVDVHCFTTLVERGRAAVGHGDLSEAASVFREAERLWRGPAFGGVGESFLLAEADRLNELRLSVQEERIAIELQTGRGDDLIPELAGLVAAHPLNERLRGHLMTALSDAGRQADALEVYQEGRRVLAEELGIDPGGDLQRLHAEILAGEPAAPVRLTTVPAELPPVPGDFVGRARELATLRSALLDGIESVRLCVVSGMPGCGKTTLAVAAGQSVRNSFPDGQLFVDLRGSDAQRPPDPSRTLRRLLRALGVSDAAVPESLEARAALFRSVLTGRRLLLVLDDAAGEWQVRSLLPGTAGSTVLITSRYALAGLEGTIRFAPGPLPLQSGTELLAETAGRDRVTADPAAAARIVELCGGLPLALRVIGARLGMHPSWPLPAMVRRLSCEERRLDELTAGDLAVRSSLETGYRRLNRAERRAFRALGGLAGPFCPSSLAARLGVAEDVAEELAERLAEAHLVEATVDGRGRPGYHCHDLLRIYARERADLEGDPVEHAMNRFALPPPGHAAGILQTRPL
ncbi:AfsR/SARP family transcriptional regulator [Actinomadura parmotrematis]|uniref:AfsR/SARP family transcriptional regulator n=1 Tax=Actinomadura parmotrematis TaxID=2864039 RepID=UPI0027E32EBA|nr:BTAD domain-containing putative transcriptional regulator [Actinomadura parmotrematis]